MKIVDKYPMISRLFGAYFNQDWDKDYSSTEAVIQGFVHDGSKSEIGTTISELEELLKEIHTREEWLCIIYDDFGCFCNLEYDGLKPTEWLEKVKKQLEEELALMDENKKEKF